MTRLWLLWLFYSILGIIHSSFIVTKERYVTHLLHSALSRKRADDRFWECTASNWMFSRNSSKTTNVVPHCNLRRVPTLQSPEIPSNGFTIHWSFQRTWPSKLLLPLPTLSFNWSFWVYRYGTSLLIIVLTSLVGHVRLLTRPLKGVKHHLKQRPKKEVNRGRRVGEIVQCWRDWRRGKKRRIKEVVHSDSRGGREDFFVFSIFSPRRFLRFFLL